jgi:hypothetical protein
MVPRLGIELALNYYVNMYPIVEGWMNTYHIIKHQSKFKKAGAENMKGFDKILGRTKVYQKKMLFSTYF